jgi:hypothetical protein
MSRRLPARPSALPRDFSPLRPLADQAFSRAAGAPLVSVHVADPDVTESISLGPGHPVEQVEAVHPLLRRDHCVIYHWLRDISGLSPGTVASGGVWLEPVAVRAPTPAPPGRLH